MTLLYYKLQPEQIVKDIIQSKELKKVQIKGKEFLIFPHVYPSDQFRTTNFLLDSIQPLLQNATICDMGCGMGIVGLFALQHNAKRVVQVDVSSIAIENAKANIALYHYSANQIKAYESSCFDNVPKQPFDMIIFNIPFHSEQYEIKDPLEYAFHDPSFTSTRKFLCQAISYCHNKTNILIAFSNKGDIRELEEVFEKSDFNWELWKKTNAHLEYDNRIYRLRVKKCQ